MEVAQVECCLMPTATLFLIARPFCSDVNECRTDPCEQICVNIPGGFVCECDEGYVKRNQTCVGMEGHYVTSRPVTIDFEFHKCDICLT